jgi:hypothetical protein
MNFFLTFSLLTYLLYSFVDGASRKSNTAKTHCTYKLDLSKAHDHVDWTFLALRKMGFCETWAKWVMTFVRLVLFSVTVNGVTLELF